LILIKSKLIKLELIFNKSDLIKFVNKYMNYLKEIISLKILN